MVEVEQGSKCLSNIIQELVKIEQRLYMGYVHENSWKALRKCIDDLEKLDD
jgi:hypothetical protein